MKRMSSMILLLVRFVARLYEFLLPFGQVYGDPCMPP